MQAPPPNALVYSLIMKSIFRNDLDVVKLGFHESWSDVAQLGFVHIWFKLGLFKLDNL